MKNKVMYSLFGIFFTFIVLGLYAINGIGVPLESNSLNQGIDIEGYEVVISTTGDFEGRETPSHEGIYEIVGKPHNTLYNDGMDMTYNCLSSGSCDAITNITLCNTTCATPVAAGTEDYIEHDTCGLTSAIGTVYEQAGNGNWTVENTFTSTCDDVVTNVTRLQNTSTKFAGVAFTSVTLQTDDQLNINWSIKVS